MKKISVLITGVSGGGVGRQVLKALRISHIPYRITGTDITQFSFGFLDCDKTYVVPLANDAKYLSTILKICKKEKIQILIPGSEPELKVISSNRELFRNILILINEKRVIDICSNKWKTYEFFKDNNINFPKSFSIKKILDIKKIKKFPIILKPVGNSSGSSNVFVVRNKKELELIAKYLLNQRISILAQEYIGSGDEEYTVGALSDFNGDLIGVIPIRRIVKGALSLKSKVKSRSFNKKFLSISSGISQGTIGSWKDIKKYVEEIVEKLKSKGPLNIQCRKTKDGFFAFEINPRFSGTTFLRAMAGFNEPDILIRKHFLGEKIIKPIKYKNFTILRDFQEKIV